MPDINENDYQYAEDLPVEDHSTLDGSEKFVMFDDESGKQVSLSEMAIYMDNHLDAGNKINTVKVDGTALVPDVNKAVNIDLSGKVDKISGKGLSTNDYTTTEKNKLNGIETGANKIIVDADLNETSTNPVQNKKVTEAIEDLDGRKAEIDGYYDEMSVGTAEQLLSSTYEEDKVPYTFRKSGGSISVGDREYVDAILGGTVTWNQLVKNGKGDVTTSWGSVRGTVATDGTALTATCSNTGFMTLINACATSAVGHKCLCLFYGKCSVANTNLIVSMSSQSIGNNKIVPSYMFSAANTWYEISGIGIITLDETTQLRFGVDATVDDTLSVKNVRTFDLTAMFGPTIADYIYSLETATAGSGIAKLREWGFFRDSYYAYDPGSLQSVCVGAHSTTGKNLLKPSALISGGGTGVTATVNNDGSITLNGTPNATQFIGFEFTINAGKYMLSGCPSGGGASTYQANFRTTLGGTVVTTDTGSGGIFNPTEEMTLYYSILIASGVNVTGKTFYPMLRLSSVSDSTFEPYDKNTYALDSDLVLRGIPKLDSNNKLYYDGDLYHVDGGVDRRYNEKTFTSCDSVGVSNGIYYTVLKSLIPASVTTNDGNAIISNGYTRQSRVETGNWYITGAGAAVVVVLNDQTITTKADADAYLAQNPITVVYELATPTTETATPYTAIQICDSDGTEEFVDALVEAGTRDVAIPAGHTTRYVPDLRAKLERSPDNPSNNGDYILRKSASGVSYVPLTLPSELPEAPSANGTYTLKVTISNGTPTYSWVNG